jgi:putative methylase
MVNINNISKSSLAIILSKLKTFDKPNIKLEQYSTDSEIAANIVWIMHMKNQLKEKVIADFGSGCGILGLACLILGAKKVYFIDIDNNSLEIINENIVFLKDEFDVNIKKTNYEILNIDIKSFDKKVDCVIQNPPFGTREKNQDKIFLLKAFELSNIVYSLHKTSTSKFIMGLGQKNNFNLIEKIDFNYPLKNTYKQHKSKIKIIEVSLFIFNKS